MARRRGGPAPATAVASPAVLGTVAVMALVYYSTVFVFLDHWVGLATPAGAAHAAAVSLAVAACFLAFVCAAGADPGTVPSAFAPDAEAAQGQVGELTEISLSRFPCPPSLSTSSIGTPASADWHKNVSFALV
jgi:palmitoyltransferase